MKPFLPGFVIPREAIDAVWAVDTREILAAAASEGFH